MHPDLPPVTETRRALLKAVSMAVVLMVLIYGVRRSPLSVYLDPENLEPWQELVGDAGAWAKPLFIAVGTVIISVGVPRTVVSLAGGMLFGIGMGLVTAMTATMLSAMLTFYIGRWAGHRYVRRRFGERVGEVRRMMRQHGVVAMILIRQLPITALASNLLCSVSGVRARHYFLGSLVGLLPGAIIFVVFGAGVRRNFGLRATAASVLLVAVTFLALWIVNHTPWLQPLREMLKKEEEG
jgi:phospholipase D1/2